MDTFAARLRYWRNMRRFSQRALSRATGISQTYIGKLEAGTSTPTIPIVERLAAALEVDLAELWPAARPIVQPNDPEYLDLVERSGADGLSEPHRSRLMQQLWESLELKRARDLDERERTRRAHGG